MKVAGSRMTWLRFVTGITGFALAIAGGNDLRIEQASAQSAPKTAQTSSIATRKAAQAALHTGYKSLTAKNTKQAISDLSRAIASGKLRSKEIAKALYYRGQAYSAAKRPAEAIADLTSALWMKGALSERDRKAALTLRQKTYQQAGVAGPALGFGSTTTTQTTTTPSTPRQPATTTRSNSTRAAAKPKPTQQTWKTATAKQTTNSSSTGSSSNGVATFFSNLFGGTSSTSPSSTGSVNSQPRSTQSSTAKPSAAWQSTTNSSAAKRTKVARAAVRAPKTTNTGRYYIQVASVRDPGQAKSLARSVATRHQALLSGRQPTVETGVLGNMGTFYLVRIRAFQSRTAASKLCGKLLASGLDCLVNGG